MALLANSSQNVVREDQETFFQHQSSVHHAVDSIDPPNRGSVGGSSVAIAKQVLRCAHT